MGAFQRRGQSRAERSVQQLRFDAGRPVSPAHRLRSSSTKKESRDSLPRAGNQRRDSSRAFLAAKTRQRAGSADRGSGELTMLPRVWRCTLALLLLAGCGDKTEVKVSDSPPTEQKEVGKPVTGDWLVIHSLSDPELLNPLTSSDASSSE